MTATRKMKIPIIVAAILAPVLAVFALIGTLSPSYQKCVVDHLHETVASSPHIPLFLLCEGAFIDENNGTLTALATIAIAGFTLTLWLATTEQGRLTRETLKLARDEFNASHRPKIIIHSIEFRRIPGEEEIDRIGASILCFNTGNAAAEDVQVRGDILVTDSLSIDVQRPLLNTIAELPSGIKLRFEVTSERPVRELPHLLKQATPYCIGTVAYLDQNHMRRETGFCFIIKEITAHGACWVSAESPEHEYAY